MTDSLTKQISKPIKSISLVFCWGNTNAGDKAITPGMVKLIKNAFPGCNLTVVSLFGPHSDNFRQSREYITGKFPDVHFVPQPMQFVNLRKKGLSRRINRYIGLLSLISPPLVHKIFRQNEGFASLIKSDLIICNCGVLFFWDKVNERPFRVLFPFMYPFLIARRLGIEHGFYGQTLGPFIGVGKRLFRWFFSSAKFIFTRESISKSYIDSLGVKTNNIKIVGDTAFVLDFKRDRGILDTYSLKEKEFVVVTLRATTIGFIGKLDERKVKEHFTFMRRYLEDLNSKTNLTIVIIAQIKRDQEISRAMLEALKDKAILIMDINTPEELINLYSYSSFVIGMRLHSLIFGFVGGVPSIGIYYKSISHKMVGIMNDLGLNDFVFDIDSVNYEDLLKQTLEVYHNRETISKRITNVVKNLNQKSLESLRSCLNAECRDK